MNGDESKMIPSGFRPLDKIIQGLRLGDNVVWQVDNLSDYQYFAEPFISQALRDGRKCVYMRFAPHEPILQPQDSLEIIKVDSSPGFDLFSGEVHKIIGKQGREVFYLFDNLSALVSDWATDELLADFFQVTCPFLFELDTVAYFALRRGQHSHSAVARIRDTTQVLLNVYGVKGKKYIHPLKVWDRYSSYMFLPHVISGSVWLPIFNSGDAAEVTTTARKKPLGTETGSIAPWESVYRKLVQYRETGTQVPESSPEIATLKKEFLRMMIGHHSEFNKLVDHYFTLDDLFGIRDRIIGSGRIGGKTVGMLLARKILLKNSETTTDFSQTLEGHDSFYIGSDVFFTFLVNNDLFRLRWQLSSNSQFSRDEFDKIEQRFLAGKFPSGIVEQFRNMLDYFGQAPIIIRSSSLLEDGFGNAFAGKYRSEFCANQGNPHERLSAFLRAVKLVYASALNPDALSYRRKRELGESDEQMAILVQRVSGMLYKNYFFPALAGVALSRNLFVWTDRIDPKKGIIRLVFGLGTRAVDRVGFDYPRMIPVSNPQLRPEYGLQAAKYSQRQVDLIDLKANQFTTLPITEILKETNYPYLHLYVSEKRYGFLSDPVSNYLKGSMHNFVFTFNNLINQTGFVRIIGEMVSELEKAYGLPIETEFTASVGTNGNVRVNLLQCRPMSIPGGLKQVAVPDNIPRKRVLFKAQKCICGGVIDKIRYIVYIYPERYATVEDIDKKKSLGRIVGRINAHFHTLEGPELLMGPGRFGSSNIDLGVNVSYADINNAAVLVEMACEQAGHIPEVSY